MAICTEVTLVGAQFIAPLFLPIILTVIHLVALTDLKAARLLSGFCKVINSERSLRKSHDTAKGFLLSLGHAISGTNCIRSLQIALDDERACFGPLAHGYESRYRLPNGYIRSLWDTGPIFGPAACACVMLFSTLHA